MEKQQREKNKFNISHVIDNIINDRIQNVDKVIVKDLMKKFNKEISNDDIDTMFQPINKRFLLLQLDIILKMKDNKFKEWNLGIIKFMKLQHEYYEKCKMLRPYKKYSW